jgi:L-ascorbate metabolism protein UlaG (beta-lactamase superfamily)
MFNRKIKYKLPITLLFMLGFSSSSVMGIEHKYLISDHFDGNKFFNLEPEYTFVDMIKWIFEMKTVKWPEWINDTQQPAPPQSVDANHLRVTYINHATVLIQIDGINILTDPIWSMWAGPNSWLGVRRVRHPGIKIENLPHIDYILISHNHYDHLDLPTLKKLKELHNPKILTGLGLCELLCSKSFSKVEERDWWQQYETENNNIQITFVPSLHSSGRGLFDKNKSLWGGFVIQTKTGRSVYFAGDTGYGQFIENIKRKFSGFDLAIFPIGNYEARWFMKNQHMNPDDAVKAHKYLNVKQSIGMHYATFAEHPEQTIDAHEIDLKKALQLNGMIESEFRILGFGEGFDVF